MGLCRNEFIDRILESRPHKNIEWQRAKFERLYSRKNIRQEAGHSNITNTSGCSNDTPSNRSHRHWHLHQQGSELSIGDPLQRLKNPSWPMGQTLQWHQDNPPI